MKNCLVTKLKSAVNNSNLLKVGEIRFNLKKPSNWSVSNEFIVRANTTEGFDLKVISGDLSLTCTEMSLTGTSFEIRSMTVYHFKIDSGSEGVISISNKYNLQRIGIADRNLIHANVYDMVYSPITYYMGSLDGMADAAPNWSELISLEIQGESSITGSIYDLLSNVSNNKISLLKINTGGLTGNIQDIAVKMYDSVLASTASEGVAVMNLSNSSIRGTISSYVAIKRAAGQSTGRVKLQYCGGKLTVEGTTVVNGNVNTEFTWDADTITVTDNNVETVYNM